MKTIFIVILIAFACGPASAADGDGSESGVEVLGRQLVQQGRTLVHHAVKRFMFILPAIFFKLGIAFTLLILIALAAANNGFIGFLLLVVGMSSVLARLQEVRSAAVPVPYISPLPPYHHTVWDRSDSGERSEAARAPDYGGYVGQRQHNPSLASYYAKYGSVKA